ncbi:MAG: fimbrial protein [Rhizobiaceae bacterium]|nr:fimbrial protein [Hyphomicrobiales bacterium]NRB30570.1 fimbrial protein [Rhizobiaceae bacterium]
MSNQEEEPLDPAVEAIRVKMVRLLAISGGIMMLGLMAVLISIVYKVTQDSSPPPKAAVASTNNEIVIPAGAEVVATSQSGGRITLTLRLQDGATAIQVHDASGALIASYAVREQ